MFEDDADADVLGLARAAQSVLARTRALDPARRIQALDALQQMVAAERLAATAEARRTEAFAETHQSLKTWIADLTHTDASVAKTWTALAGFEARLPGLASALASGAASLEHVRVAVRALRRVEDDDARAVDPVITEAAETCTPSELAQLLAH
ncbi:MAG TPA: hypothetical protein VHE83_01215, partial [Mycobacteriales bacterium]|nr:hypothetical protein [Mycobacteriales bacterium]